jgi:hypothetical protein
MLHAPGGPISLHQRGQPRWVGPNYWAVRFSCRHYHAKPWPKWTGFGCRNVPPLHSRVSRQHDTARHDSGGPARLNGVVGKFSWALHGFHIDGLGLDFDDIAFANIAWCATVGKSLSGDDAGPLLRATYRSTPETSAPNCCFALGNTGHGFGKKIAAIVPETPVIKDHALRPSRSTDESDS